MIEWWEHALCKGMDVALFFPGSGKMTGQEKREHLAELNLVRDMCRHCPVREQCLIEGEGQPGVWGGLTAEERRNRERA